MTEKQLANRLTKFAPRVGKAWVAQIIQALSEQTVVVLGTRAATVVLPRLAQQLAALRRQREDLRPSRDAVMSYSPTLYSPPQTENSLTTT